MVTHKGHISVHGVVGWADWPTPCVARPILLISTLIGNKAGRVTATGAGRCALSERNVILGRSQEAAIHHM